MVRGPAAPTDKPATWKTMPAYYFFRLWNNHFGATLLETQVEAPKLEFEGCLDTRPARKEDKDVKESGEVYFSLRPGAGKGHQWQITGKRAMSLKLDRFTGEAYPPFSEFKVIPGRTYRLSYEARIIGNAVPAAKLGIGLCDLRGWHATRSAIGIEGIDSSHDWNQFTGTITTLPDADGLFINWRLIGDNTPISAGIEIRSIDVTRVRDFTPYATLTASSSLSSDGRILYLIVFNKHHQEKIAAQVRVADLEISLGLV